MLRVCGLNKFEEFSFFKKQAKFKHKDLELQELHPLNTINSSSAADISCNVWVCIFLGRFWNEPPRQPLLKGERLVRHEVNIGVSLSVFVKPSKRPCIFYPAMSDSFFSVVTSNLVSSHPLRAQPCTGIAICPSVCFRSGA